MQFEELIHLMHLNFDLISDLFAHHHLHHFHRRHLKMNFLHHFHHLLYNIYYFYDQNLINYLMMKNRKNKSCYDFLGLLFFRYQHSILFIFYYHVHLWLICQYLDLYLFYFHYLWLKLNLNHEMFHNSQLHLDIISLPKSLI